MEEKLRELIKNLPHFPKSDSQESENKGTISKKNYSLLQFVNDIPQFKPYHLENIIEQKSTRKESGKWKNI